jgi:DNA polymerase elongation subunit (family B)
MVEGWLLDVHEDVSNTGMVAWVVDDEGQAHACSVPWQPVIHVHASHHDLDGLEHWLGQPEIWQRFGLGQMHMTRARLDLETHGQTDVLEVGLRSFRHLRGLAEHIEARGDFHRFKLYSVDAHFAQRFLNEHECVPFGRVRWSPDDPGRLTPLPQASNEGTFPPLHVVKMRFQFQRGQGLPVIDDPIENIHLETVQEPGLDAPKQTLSMMLKRDDYSSTASMLSAFQLALNQMDPDVVLTSGGDQRWFPWLVEQSRVHGISMALGRRSVPLHQSTSQRTIHSYGQTRHRHGAFFLQGRLHLDVKNSFIVNEGGLAGLFELAQHSRQSAQIISRLSPGSVISAIQMRVAMDDGVLVPWKKNRPEDTKSALDLLHADRGGLYLDSRPGVHASVIELDFASLFPSIIATRNISPETLNCSCCQSPPTNSNRAIVPLHPEQAAQEFQERRVRSQFGHGLFPIAHKKALAVPGLNMHTCGRIHGFLGRVVAPIIERRRVLKGLREQKGDAYDLRQNALKWLLVTCFGYTGYRNARFGRIEAHEAICAWSRDLLLTTIEAAQDDGWDVLHAIVDCVWLSDAQGRSAQQQRSDAEAFAKRLSSRVGIPLEFEAHYDFIAFLPSRVHGSGSLTKYWAYDGDSFKVRGIELRQHSTPPWVRNLQQHGLELLAEGERIDGIPSHQVQRSVWRHYRAELRRLSRGEVPLSDLIIARRTSRGLEDYRVRNLTYAALLRAHERGYKIPPGGKVRYVVLNRSSEHLLERVMLAEEVERYVGPGAGCPTHYGELAERAVWALLAPFGWTNEQLRNDGSQPTLLSFMGCDETAARPPPKKGASGE